MSSLRVGGRELLQAGRAGNELLVYDEHPAHPSFHEGPWHLLPSGGMIGSADAHAEVVVMECPAGRRIVVTGRVGPVAYTQEITLWDGLPRVDLTTHVDEFDGADKLLRLRWPVSVPGALPVSEVGNAVIGRGFGLIDVDSAEHPWTLDNPAHNWFALSSTARVVLRPPGRGGGGRGESARAIGIAEIIAPAASDFPVRELAVALVRQGVTSTCSTGPGPRYGDLAVDSNLPDVRIAVGTPEENPFVAELLDDGEAALLRERLDAHGRARIWIPAAEPLEKVWVPGADLTGPRTLPVLVVCGEGAVEDLIADLDDATIEVVQPDAEPAEPLDDYTVGLINRGVPGFAVDSSGAMHVSLMRSCTGWPSGIWIDPPRRAAPDGSNFQLQHWTHSFECALVAAPGDWRDADLVRLGHDVNHPLLPVWAGAVPAGRSLGEGGEARSFLETGPGVVLTALKAAGNPIASGRTPGPVDGVTVRLYEAHGGAADPAITTSLPVGPWERADLLENVTGKAPGTLTGMEIVTLRAGLPDHAAGRATSPGAAVAAEPHQPVYTRYWLNNTGPAPLGNLPVAVHLSETDVDASGPMSLALTLASGLTEEEAAGAVALTPPDGWTVEPATVPYALSPGGHALVSVRLAPPAGVRGGLYLLRATTEFGGQAYEDVTRLHVGGRHAIGPEVSLEGLGDPPFVRLRPGGEAEIVVRLQSGALSPMSVQAQLISPWHTFELFPGWNTGVVVPAEGEAEVRFAVRPPKGARPGRWWAVVKLAAAGWLHYTDTIEVEVL
ncbi:NEW3 domain-containing protein [Planotetraspora sp. A-T 1434]|uniref:NEW3 domain-containing protein n=1 Tax=Planotetraspora sp. A-T 1434 TaxID=2979219 RepID=UPI0021BE3EA7|nr:NEW3 domain-containing protein [Planotetraspora sp. A-T 1434]MCT9930275.1 NEW3 domain-containing protein [Planotetraspora sp. A-T 1434]